MAKGLIVIGKVTIMGKFLFCDCAYHDGNLFFFSSQNGLLTKLDIESHDVSYLPTIVEETYGKIGSVDTIQIYRDKIYALMTAGDGLIEYDLKDNSYRCYNPECAENPWGNYIYMTEYNSQLFIFVRAKNVVKVFDCEKKEFTTIEYNIKDQTFHTGTRVNDKVWLFPQKGNSIASFDLITGSAQEYVADIEFADIVSCYADNHKIYIVSRKGDVWIWNTEELKLEIFRKAKENEKMGRIMVTKENIILLPSLGENIVIISKNNRSERIYDEYPVGFRYEAHPTWSKYYGYCRDKNKIYFAMRSANYILIIDEESGKIFWKKPLEKAESEKISFLVSKGKTQLAEQNCSLEGFIEYLISNDNEKITCENQMMIGAQIYGNF